LTGCHDSVSYAELLDEENRATNAFLVNQQVVGSVPENNEFEVGINAPYYQLDEDGFVFMQVLNAGTKGNNAVEDQQIYFRWTRYSLKNYSYDGTSENTNGYYGKFTSGEGNSETMGYGNTFFRFKNQTSPSTTQWGEGIQLPLEYLPIDCEVNLVIKSQMGWTEEQTYVTPYFYNVRYFKSQI
ncbi:MAG: DUF4827 domain-containing protein, partial [Muribaculaceae bacterium]|nr:DUF4827 domain-containing protein [Muribaculaceae bacterium]